MKLKAVLHKGCDPDLVAALESKEFRDGIIDTVLIQHLHADGGIGPAEFYIQECDFAVGGESMCEVRLTGVSGVTMRRSPQDFLDARDALEEAYRRVLEKFLPESGSMQLMVSIMLDRGPELLRSNLIERQGDSAIMLKRTIVPPR